MNNKILLGILAIALIAGLGYLATAEEADRSPAAVNNEQVGNNNSEMGGTNSGENSGEGGGVHNLPVEPAAAKARADLAAKLKVGEGGIVIMKVEEKTWSDGCLGLGGPAESCIMMLIDGFRVELEASGKTYVYRTDKTGSSLRLETN